MYKLSENILFQKVDQETVILSSETGEYFTLDAVGTFMAEELNAGKSVEEVITRVTTDYDVDKDTVTADLAELITSLKTEGILIEA